MVVIATDNNNNDNQPPPAGLLAVFIFCNLFICPLFCLPLWCTKLWLLLCVGDVFFSARSRLQHYNRPKSQVTRRFHGVFWKSIGNHYKFIIYSCSQQCAHCNDYCNTLQLCAKYFCFCIKCHHFIPVPCHHMVQQSTRVTDFSENTFWGRDWGDNSQPYPNGKAL